MSALLAVQDKLLSTNALIARIERAAASNAPTLATLSNLRSLVHQRTLLQREFEIIAHRNEIDVYHYRILPIATERLTLDGVTNAWKTFQTLFSVVYDALKNGPKLTARIGAAEAADTAFGFGYSYPGSLGVVLTLPNEKLLVGETFLGLATQETFKLAQAKTSEEIAASAKRLGPPAIRALYKWSEAHVNHGLGAGIEWRREDREDASVLIQYQQMEALQGAIRHTSDITESVITVEGVLDGAHVTQKTFCVKLPDGTSIEGSFADAIGNDHAVELPKRYRFTIRKTTKMQYAYDKEQVRYLLLDLTPI
jgi:hypothetical protein